MIQDNIATQASVGLMVPGYNYAFGGRNDVSRLSE
jgi:hypothetical protein